jgi:hypothetical protein
VPVDIALFNAPGPPRGAAVRCRTHQARDTRPTENGDPLWVSRDEYARLERYFPVVPDADDGARAVVASAYRDLGWNVDDVHARQPGRDLVCTAPGGHVLHIATRTASNDRPAAPLTKADLEAAARDPDWRLAVITPSLAGDH